MRQSCGRNGRRRTMIILSICIVFLFLYLIYALIHPEKF
ncbi:K(+)-transporting ATPase subunit F [Paenibacillus apiarius]|nr:K(+)-transporting ATPase subunit F [Paenibacillus apiarius]